MNIRISPRTSFFEPLHKIAHESDSRLEWHTNMDTVNKTEKGSDVSKVYIYNGDGE